MIPEATEAQVQKAVLEYLWIRGIFCWRNNTGATRVGNSRRFVHFGFPGSSDILGELPGHWREFLTMRGVTVTWTNGVQGLVLTALRTLSGSNSPMTINTPHFTRESYNEDDESDMGIFSLECGEDIDYLEAAVFRFVDGARAQQELNFEEEQPEEVVTLA